MTEQTSDLLLLCSAYSRPYLTYDVSEVPTFDRLRGRGLVTYETLCDCYVVQITDKGKEAVHQTSLSL